MAYWISAKARRDLLKIWRYIADDNDSAADRFLELLQTNFEMLGTNPKAGRSRDEVCKGYRSFPVGNYNIFYRVGRPGVRIIRVIHGRRNLPDVLTH
jgi:toxin ParE1/3/4